MPFALLLISNERVQIYVLYTLKNIRFNKRIILLKLRDQLLCFQTLR